MKLPWLFSPFADSIFIIGPAFITTLIVILFPNIFGDHTEVSPLAWFFLVVLVDVSHVYSTLFRTYFDKAELRERKWMYILIPISCWLVGSILYSIDELVFWKILAYLAVFHFIRQQYGFMRLYARKDRELPRWAHRLDGWMIYAAALYPILWWHCYDRSFEWFVPGDFFHFNKILIAQIAGWLYITLILFWIAKEIYFIFQGKGWNLLKSAIIIGTALSWYVGIVAINGDLSFTFTNVISHGVPYMALIWLYGKRKQEALPERTKEWSPFLRKVFSPYGVLIFILCLFLFAWAEEALWDGWIWKEHNMFFGLANIFDRINNPGTLAWMIPLLSLPQSTHYVLDGFIWKISRENGELGKILK